MSEDVGAKNQRATGWRIFGFGRGPETASKLQESLRSLGYRATIIGITDDAEGDARLVAGLESGEWDGVTIGGAINGQDPVGYPATAETTRWFNRVLNIIHFNAPKAKIILLKGPSDAVPALERELGPNP
jgi:hypothetical protein